MKALVDISLYPLTDNFTPSIDQFIEGLKKHPGIQIAVGSTSTIIKGDYDIIMPVLTREMKTSLLDVPCSFNLRILGGKTADIPNPHK